MKTEDAGLSPLFKITTKTNEMKKKIIYTILYIPVFFMLSCPFIFWWQNPELSQMEIFQETWMFLIVGNLMMAWVNYIKFD